MISVFKMSKYLCLLYVYSKGKNPQWPRDNENLNLSFCIESKWYRNKHQFRNHFLFKIEGLGCKSIQNNHFRAIKQNLVASKWSKRSCCSLMVLRLCLINSSLQVTKNIILDNLNKDVILKCLLRCSGS